MQFNLYHLDLFPHFCRGKHLDFTSGDLNSGVLACESGIFPHHSISVEKVCISP